MRGEKKPVGPWWREAHCLGQGNVMFPTTAEGVERAKLLCRRCPVKRECLEYAQTPPVENFGVWAGRLPGDR